MSEKVRGFSETPAGMWFRGGERVLIVDGSFFNYFSHARLVVGGCVWSGGGSWEVQAVVNWLGMLAYWRRQGHEIHVVWDAPFETLWRLGVLKTYKSERREKVTRERVFEKAYLNGVIAPVMRQVLLDVGGVVQWWGAGLEADDLVGVVLNEVSGKGKEVGLVTADTDWEQYVESSSKGGVSWVSLRGAMCIEGEPRVSSRWQVKALVGDSADSIEGLAGVGEKSAADLMGHFVRVAAAEGCDVSDRAVWMRGWGLLLEEVEVLRGFIVEGKIIKAGVVLGFDRYGADDVIVAKGVKAAWNRVVSVVAKEGVDAVLGRLRRNAFLMALTPEDQEIADAAVAFVRPTMAGVGSRVGKERAWDELADKVAGVGLRGALLERAVRDLKPWDSGSELVVRLEEALSRGGVFEFGVDRRGLDRLVRWS